MKKAILSIAIAPIAVLYINAQSKYITRTGQATILSHTVAEDIFATNSTVTDVINAGSGDVGISVSVKSFTFVKALIQEHFNNPLFMASKQYPRMTLKEKIIKLSTIDFAKNDKYEVVGDLTKKGTAKPVTKAATSEVNNEKVTVTSKFIGKKIGSYGVRKPMGKKKHNVPDYIQVTYTTV